MLLVKGKLRKVERRSYNGKVYPKVYVETEDVRLVEVSVKPDRADQYDSHVEKEVEIKVGVNAKLSKQGKPYLSIWEVGDF